MDKSIYQRVFENWPLPRLLIERDESGMYRVMTANIPACEYFGVEHGALTGLKLDSFLEAGNTQHILQSFAVCFQSKLPVAVKVIPVMPGGIRMGSFYLNPLKNDAGDVLAIDMAERVSSTNDDALMRERDDALSIFTSIFDTSDLGILVTDHNRRIVRVNTSFCRLFEWQTMDLIGQEFTILIPPDEHEIARKRHDDFLGDAYVEKSRTLKIVKKNGGLASVLASSGVIELSGGRKFRISTVVDISRLKKIENDLRVAKNLADSANHAKSEFLANMSHELRTPLNAIIGFSDMMLTGTLGKIENDHYQGYLADIKFSAGHLLSIINDVLDMSKIEAGQMRLDTGLIDVTPHINEAMRLITPRAQEGEVSIEASISKTLPLLRVDARMFLQILLNLLSNAVKFSHKGGRVCVSAISQGDGWVSLSVQDNGIGIPEDKLDDVMRPFGQVSDARVAGGQGTGLGLPLARSMVELHGGRMVLKSEPDKGTTITCLFPVSKTQV